LKLATNGTRLSASSERTAPTSFTTTTSLFYNITMSPSSPDWSSLFSSAQSSLLTLSPLLKSTSKPLPQTQLAAYIDHTLLKLDATEAQITTLCNEAKKHHFGVWTALKSVSTWR
jgi:hypothetical protein